MTRFLSTRYRYTRTSPITLCTSALAALTSSSLAADTLPSHDNLDFQQRLPSVTVTAPTRTERARERSPSSVEVITSEDIDDSGAVMLDEVMRQHSSLFVSPNGFDYSIRGTSREDTVFLIDGRRVTGEPSRRYELNRIPANRIERIEIVKGPGSVLYGSDAIGGIINIVTKRPQPGLQGSVELQTGARTQDMQTNQNNFSFDLLGGNENTQFTLFGQTMQRDAYTRKERSQILVPDPDGPGNRKPIADAPPPGWADKLDLDPSYTIDEGRRDEAEVHSFSGSIEHWWQDELSTKFEASYLFEKRQIDYIESGRTNTSSEKPVFNIPTRWADDNRRTELSAALDWQVSSTTHLFYRLYHSRYQKERSVAPLLWAALGFDSKADSDNRAREVTLTDRVNELRTTWKPTKAHTLQLGFEHRGREYKDHLEGQDGATRWESGLFAQHEWQINRQLDLVYGARYDDASIDASNTSIEGGFVYAFASQIRLRANYAQGFKYPGVRSLTAHTRTPRGDWMLGADVILDGVKEQRHDLGAEHSESIELGLGGDLNARGTPHYRYEITAFQSEIDDRIGRVEKQGANNETYRTFSTIGDARILGVESMLEIGLAGGWGVDLSVTWIEDASWRRVADPKYRFMTNSPEWNGFTALAWRPSGPFSTQIRMRYVGERYQAVDDEQQDDRYTLVDWSASYRPAGWDEVRLFAAIDNLFDTDNETSLFADPGRFARLGMRYRFF